MGITYEDLDRALEAIDSQTPAGLSPELLEKVKGMLDASSHKRDPTPIFLPGAPG